MSKLWISAGIEVTEGKDLGQAKEALIKMVAATRHEAGNIEFEVLQDRDNPQKFTLWECWNDEHALEEHFEAAHTLEYLSQEWTRVVYVERLNRLDRKEGRADV